MRSIGGGVLAGTKFLPTQATNTLCDNGIVEYWRAVEAGSMYLSENYTPSLHRRWLISFRVGQLECFVAQFSNRREKLALSNTLFDSHFQDLSRRIAKHPDV